MNEWMIPVGPGHSYKISAASMRNWRRYEGTDRQSHKLLYGIAVTPVKAGLVHVLLIVQARGAFLPPKLCNMDFVKHLESKNHHL